MGELWVASGPILVASWAIECGYMLGLPRAERNSRAFVLLVAAGVPLFLLLWRLFVPESLRWNTLPLGTDQATMVLILGIAVPAALLLSIFMVFLAPMRVAKVLTTLIDLMAAIPSVIIGLWAFYVLSPVSEQWQQLLNQYLGWIPLFSNSSGNFSGTPFTAGLVLALMMIPIVTSVTREVLARTPADLINASEALGCSLWTMLRYVALRSALIDEHARLSPNPANGNPWLFEARALARTAAQRSITLLKNDGMLPLKPTGSIAVIGPSAAVAREAVRQCSPARWPQFTTMRSRPTPDKQRPYESGIPTLGNARERFSVKFYMVAMLFIVFDIETVFMIPWAAYYRQLSCAVTLANGACPAGQLSFFGLSEMLVFMAILVAGFVYVWKKGALQWD